MKLVDFHCHLDFKEILDIKGKMLEGFKDNNILAISNTLDFENYKFTLNEYKNNSNVKVIPGLYPQRAEKISKKDFDKYLKFIEKEKDEILAIGEVGLDLHHTKENELEKIENQKFCFEKLIELAIKIDKPIIIHTRNFEEEVLKIIEKYTKEFSFRKFCLHCYCGNEKTFEKIKELKIFVSIPHLILKENSHFKTLVKTLNINQILVETDSPYLHSKREFPNTPNSIIEIYNEIAKIKNYDKD